MKFSVISLWFVCIGIAVISFFYYPKWNKDTTEATISWDVSGYYWYLPSFFIYKDIRKQEFAPSILQKYRPTPELQQAFLSQNKNYVLKYSIGQAILMIPAFVAGHEAAKLLGYETDGFSKPYQFSVFLWSLLITLTGLIFLRKILLLYFSEVATGISLLIISFGTNFLEYGAITNAMTHSYLFTLYTLLLWFTFKFYKHPTFKAAIGLGVCIGLMALTRPTEILALLIPLLFGIQLKRESIFLKISTILQQFEKVIVAGLIIFSIGCLQLIYWKFSSGSWLVYSYEDQGFSWLSPHIFDGLLSGRAGWLIYSPIMILSLAGFVPFFKEQKSLAPSFLLFVLLFMYVTFAWDIWWYGGSIGQRALIQIYPVLAFPLASFIQLFSKINYKAILISIFGLFCIQYNLWLVHQAHYGGMLVAGEMTSQYLAAILFRNKLPIEAKKLLDTKNIYYGAIKDPLYLITKSDSLHAFNDTCLNDSIQFSQVKRIKLPASKGWLRASADFYTDNKEWDTWKMTQLVIRYYKNGKEICSDVLRVQRHLDSGKKMHIYLDSKLRNEPNEAELFFWNSEGKTKICIQDIGLVYHKGY